MCFCDPCTEPSVRKLLTRFLDGKDLQKAWIRKFHKSCEACETLWLSGIEDSSLCPEVDSVFPSSVHFFIILAALCLGEGITTTANKTA